MKKAFYYCWYGESRHWSEGVSDIPQNGKYSSCSDIVIKNHIDFAKKNNIQEYCVSWWGIDSYEDRVLMKRLRKAFYSKKIKIGILFETARYFKKESEIQYLSEESISLIVSEVEYLAHNLKDYIDSTLDIFLYLSRSIKNISDLLLELNKLKKKYPFLR